MYKYPGSNAMTFGFWQKDPLITGENWYKPTSFHPLKTSEMSRLRFQYVVHEIVFKILNVFQISQQSFGIRQMLQAVIINFYVLMQRHAHSNVFFKIYRQNKSF